MKPPWWMKLKSDHKYRQAGGVTVAMTLNMKPLIAWCLLLRVIIDPLTLLIGEPAERCGRTLVDWFLRHVYDLTINRGA